MVTSREDFTNVESSRVVTTREMYADNVVYDCKKHVNFIVSEVKETHEAGLESQLNKQNNVWTLEEKKSTSHVRDSMHGQLRKLLQKF